MRERNEDGIEAKREGAVVGISAASDLSCVCTPGLVRHPGRLGVGIRNDEDAVVNQSTSKWLCERSRQGEDPYTVNMSGYANYLPITASQLKLTASLGRQIRF